jgi:hypothetical protein
MTNNSMNYRTILYSSQLNRSSLEDKGKKANSKQFSRNSKHFQITTTADAFKHRLNDQKSPLASQHHQGGVNSALGLASTTGYGKTKMSDFLNFTLSPTTNKNLNSSNISMGARTTMNQNIRNTNQ